MGRLAVTRRASQPRGPASRRSKDRLSLREKETALKVLKKMKAPGRDGFPIELYQKNVFCRDQLFKLIDLMWKYEMAPADMLQGVFCPIYKNKGSAEDLTKYRFICLLSHASKVVSVCLLRRLVTETDWYLPVHQAGFRQHRGTRDNIFILAQIMDAVMARGEEMITVFIDYVAAFDSVSHKFIDDALHRAKASNKCSSIPITQIHMTSHFLKYTGPNRASAIC
eukprot:COSAG01_NODE_1502_length_10101_cov_6.907119_7_plen_224_part_00